jgi:hypothetical protein
LRGFNVETDLDRKIYDNILSYISDWQGDGRVFRDCEYNYSVLYGIVSENDSQLYKDFKVVIENIDCE